MSNRAISKLISLLQLGDTTVETNGFKGKLMSIEKTNKFNVLRETPFRWKEDAWDDNEIHLNKETAKKAGYEDTPLHGTLIAAYLEKHILGILKEINEFVGETFVYAGQDLVFKRPAYPEKNLFWDLGTPERFKDGVDLGITLKEDKKPLLIGISKLRHKRIDYDKDNLGSFLEGKFVAETVKEIDSERLKDIYQTLGMNQKNSVLITHSALMIPSLLIEVASKGEQDLLGRYTEMKLEFHNQPGLGEYKTIIRMPEFTDKAKKRRNPYERRGNFEYLFDAICVQEGTPILSGNINCITKNRFEV